MRRATARPALLGVGLLALALGAPAAADPGSRPLVLRDPTGDALPMTEGDIVSVTYATTMRTLQVTVTTADPIDTGGTTEYEVDSLVAGCENGFDFWYTPGVRGSEGGGCSNGSGRDLVSTGLSGPPQVRDRSLTFVFPFSRFPGRQVRPGTTITGIRAFTALVEPVVGFIGPYVVTGGLANDELRADRSYRVG